jgi:hypothetical protein
VADRGFLNGPVAVSGGGVFAGASRRVETMGQMTSGLRYITSAGKVAWAKDIGRGAPGWAVSDLAVLADGAAAVALAPVAPAAEARREDLQPEIWRVDKEGQARMIARLPIFLTQNILRSDTPVKLAAAKGRLVAAVDSGARFRTGFDLDAFHNPVSCLEGGTQFFAVTPAGAVTAGHLVEGLAVKAVTASNGEVLIAGGRRVGCGQRQNAVAAKLDSSLALDVLWQDDTPFDSQAEGIVRTGKGYRIAGNMARTMQVDEHLRPAASAGAGAIYSVTEGRTARDVFVVDPARPRERWYYDAGLDTMIDGVIAGESNIVLYGLQGPGRLWLSLAP